MGLEDDLKARTSALISQQMANWVVEIQRAIQGHQASHVRALDELGETVARSDEKVDEGAEVRSMASAVARSGAEVNRRSRVAMPRRGAVTAKAAWRRSSTPAPSARARAPG